MNLNKLTGIVTLSAILGLGVTFATLQAQDAPAAQPPAAAAPQSNEIAAAPASPAADAAPASAAAPASPAADAAASPAPAEAKKDDATAVKKQYVCEKDQIVKDAPGKCDKCGAELVEKVPAADNKGAGEKKDEKNAEPAKDAGK